MNRIIPLTIHRGAQGSLLLERFLHSMWLGVRCNASELHETYCNASQRIATDSNASDDRGQTVLLSCRDCQEPRHIADHFLEVATFAIGSKHPCGAPVSWRKDGRIYRRR